MEYNKCLTIHILYMSSASEDSTLTLVYIIIIIQHLLLLKVASPCSTHKANITSKSFKQHIKLSMDREKQTYRCKSTIASVLKLLYQHS